MNIINLHDSEDDPFVPGVATIAQKPGNILAEANPLILNFGCSAGVIPPCGGLTGVVGMTHLWGR